MSQSNSLAWEPPILTADISQRYTVLFDNAPLALVEIVVSDHESAYYCHIDSLCDMLAISFDGLVDRIQHDVALYQAVHQVKYFDRTGETRPRNADGWAVQMGYLEALLLHMEPTVASVHQLKFEQICEWVQGAGAPLLPDNDTVSIVLTGEQTIRYHHSDYQCFRAAQQTLPYVDIRAICRDLEYDAGKEYGRIRNHPVLVRGYIKASSVKGPTHALRLLRLDVLLEWLRELEHRPNTSESQRGKIRRYKKEFIAVVQQRFDLDDVPPPQAALPGTLVRVQEVCRETLEELIGWEPTALSRSNAPSSERSILDFSIDRMREIVYLADEEDALRDQQQALADRLAKVRERRERLMRGDDE